MWFLDHMIVICRIIDRTATVVALENLSDHTPEELDEEEQGEQEREQEEDDNHNLLASQMQTVQLRKAVTELELAEARLEVERGLVEKEESLQARLVAVVKGQEGEEELLAIGRKEGSTYLKKRFKETVKDFSCSSFCLLTGYDRQDEVKRCCSCGRDFHLFCQAVPEQEEAPEGQVPDLTCRLCQERAAHPTATTQQLATATTARLQQEAVQCTPRLLTGFEHLLPIEAVSRIPNMYDTK